MRLAVELYGRRIGHLEGGDSRTFTFTETAEAVREFGAGSRILSVAIPLGVHPRRADAGRRRNFFAELLPEGRIRTAMFDAAGIRGDDDVLAFLGVYGRDVAGALQIWNLDDPTEPKEGAGMPVDDRQIRSLMERYLRTPLGNAPHHGRTSLAGVQPKIVLARDGGTWLQAIDGYPSTHILKPALADGSVRESMIFDEEYGARVARSAGIRAVDARIERFAGLDALVITRYDRDASYPENRVHQEDFNQVLGASGDQKYQEHGGRVTLRRVAEALEVAGAPREVETLAEQVVLACAIGNLDLHAKNLSVLHLHDGTVRLAPAYDVVPLTHVPGIDGRMAMAVGGVYVHAAITRADIIRELGSWRFRRAERVVDEVLARLLDAAEREAPLPGAAPTIQEDVVRITRNLVSGEAAGRTG